MVRRRGIQLLVVSVLGLILWAFAGASGVIVDPADGVGSGHDGTALVTPLSADLGTHAAVVRVTHDRIPAARAQRVMALAAVLVGAGLVVRASRSNRTRLDDLPVWSGWFDPGLLRGPPTA
jgi:hypothetical protein